MPETEIAAAPGEEYTVTQTATALNVMQDQVYRLLRVQRLAAIKRDGIWRISADAVHERIRARAKKK